METLSPMTQGTTASLGLCVPYRGARTPHTPKRASRGGGWLQAEKPQKTLKNSCPVGHTLAKHTPKHAARSS